MRSSIALSVGFTLAAVVSAQAADYTDQIALKAAQIYEKNGRARIVLSVNNNSPDVLDITVGCDFLDGSSKKIGSGHGSVSRLPPRRSDTVEVVDEVAQRAESARCNVVNAQK